MGSCQKYDPFALSDSNDEDEKKEIEGHHELYSYEAKYKKDPNSLTPEGSLFHDDQSSGDKDGSSSFSDEEEENDIKPNDVNFIPVPNSNNKDIKETHSEPFIPPPPKDPYPDNVSGLTKQYKFNDNSVANLIAKASAKLMQEPMNNSNQTSNQLASHQTHAIHNKLPLFGKRGKYFVPTQLRVRRQVEDQQQNLKSKNSMQEMFNEDINNSYDDVNNQIYAPATTGEHGGKKTSIYLPEPLDKRISLINDESIPFPKTIDIPKPSLAHIPHPGNVTDMPTPKFISDLSSITTPSAERQTDSVDRGLEIDKKVEKVEGGKRKFYQSYEAWAQSVHQDHRSVVNSNNTDVLGQQPKPVTGISDKEEGSIKRGHKSSPKRHSPTTSGGGYGKGTTRGRSPLPPKNKNGDRRRMTSTTHHDRKKELSSRRIVLPDEGSTTFSVTRFLDPLPNIGRDPTSSNILYLHTQRGGRGRGIEESGAKVKLAWPVDILKYTRTQPCITYACNPRQFNLNKLSSRKADIVVDVLMTWPRKPLYPELTFVEAGPENTSPARAEASSDTNNDSQDNHSPEAPIESRSPKPQLKNEDCDLVLHESTALAENCSTAVRSPSSFNVNTAIPMEHNDKLKEENSFSTPNIIPEKEIANTASPAIPETELEPLIEPQPSHRTPLITPDVDSNVTTITEPSSKPGVLEETRDLQDASKPNTDIPLMSGPDLAAIQRLLGANLLNSDLANTLNDSLSPLLSVINNLVTLSLTNSPLLKSLSALLKTPGHIQKLIAPQPSEGALEMPSKEDKKSVHQVTALQSGGPVDKAEQQQPDTSPGELMQDITSLLLAHITPTSSSSVEVGAPKSEVPSPCVSILKAPTSSTSNHTNFNLEPPQVERGEEEKEGRERIVAFDLPLDISSPPSPSVRHKRAALLSRGVKRKGSKKGHNSPSSPPPPPPPAPPHTTNVVKSRSKKGVKKDKKRRQDSESPPPPPPPPPPATKEVVGEEVIFLSPRPQPPPHFTGLVPQPSPYYYHQGVGTALGQQQPSPSLPMYLTHNVAAMYARPPTLNYMNNTAHLQQQQQMGLYSNQIDYVAINNSMNASVMSNCINTTLAQAATSPYNLLGISNSLILPQSQPPLFMSPPPPDKSAKILVSQYANPNLIRIATTQTFV